MPFIKSYSESLKSSFNLDTRSPPTTPVFIILEDVAIAMCDICASIDSPDLWEVIILILFFAIICKIKALCNAMLINFQNCSITETILARFMHSLGASYKHVVTCNKTILISFSKECHTLKSSSLTGSSA